MSANDSSGCSALSAGRRASVKRVCEQLSVIETQHD
jgi:hypothetical protein